MRKQMILLPLAMVILTGCETQSSSSDAQPEEEKITLSSSNFSKYVATSSSSTVNANNNNFTYYTHFIGADGFRFIDCTVTYGYAYSGSAYEDSGTTVSLTLSGDGEALPFHVRISQSNAYYTFTLISASGEIRAIG